MNLEYFETIVSVVGIDLVEQAKKNRIDKEIRHMISHLKENSKFKMRFEKYDKSLIKQLNNIKDKYVE